MTVSSQRIRSPVNPGRFTVARRRRERRGSHFTESQWRTVLFLLSLKWSPEQISETLKRYGLFSISYETIYLYLLHDRRHGGKHYLNLRHVPKRRRKRYGSKDSRGRLAGKRHISERPPEVETRKELGHWEADTVVGPDKRHCIVTLVERVSGYLIIRKCSARTVEEVTAACRTAIAEHGQAFKTITFDNGTEFHGYKDLELSFPVSCYFATPYHSWERGMNENTNGLIRQYIPKKACMKDLSQAECDRIAHALNTRPRKRHCYRTPLELYSGDDPLLHLMLEAKPLLREYLTLQFNN